MQQYVEWVLWVVRKKNQHDLNQVISVKQESVDGLQVPSYVDSTTYANSPVGQGTSARQGPQHVSNNGGGDECEPVVLPSKFLTFPKGLHPFGLFACY